MPVGLPKSLILKAFLTTMPVGVPKSLILKAFLTTIAIGLYRVIKNHNAGRVT